MSFKRLIKLSGRTSPASVLLASVAFLGASNIATADDATFDTGGVKPIRTYFEFGYDQLTSRGSNPGKVDMQIYSGRSGIDFITPSGSLFGFSLEGLHSKDNGTYIFAPSVVTNKNIGSISGYFTQPLSPRTVVGVSGTLDIGRGRTVYNGAAVDNEKSTHFAGTAYLYDRFINTGNFSMNWGVELAYNHGSFAYVTNVPPQAAASRWMLSVPISADYHVSDAWSIQGFFALNTILMDNSFSNVPPDDKFTVSVGLGSTYTFETGHKIYGRWSTDLADSNYRSNRFTVGLSFPIN